MSGAARQPLLSVRGVQTFYGKIRALKGIDLDVFDSEIVALIGANGAGKSTLMMTICGNPQASGTRSGTDRKRRFGAGAHGSVEGCRSGRPGDGGLCAW